MAAVGVGGVEETEAVVVVAVEEEPGEWRGAETGLVGGAAEADGAGSHGETGGADAGFAEDDLVLRVKFLGERVRFEKCGASDGGPGEKGGSQGAGRAAKEVSPQHGAISLGFRLSWIAWGSSQGIPATKWPHHA